MTMIHLIGGEKGGVGKTFVSRCLLAYFTLQDWDFDLIEADNSTGDVASIHPPATHITLSDHPQRYAEPDVIFSKAIEKPVIVNLPSNTQGVLNRWIKQVNLLTLSQQHDISLLYWFVTDGCYASIRLLQESLADLHYQIPHLLIRNRGRLNGIDFSYLEQDAVYQKALTAPNLVNVFDFPVLGSAEQYFVDRHHLNLIEAQVKIAEDRGVIAAQRIKTFFDEVIDLLGNVDFQPRDPVASDPALKPKIISP
jgi:hypothetical protein